MSDHYDVVVIGSGFGGGIAACRLAEAGVRVCVLERGRRFSPEDFISEPADAPKLLWHEQLNPDGMFDVRIMRDVSVITAAGLGGGSLVYANVQLRAPAGVFADGWPEAIDRSTLDPFYDRTEEALQPVTTPTEPALAKVGAFAAAADRAGFPSEPLPIAVHFGEDRTHPFSGVPQRACQNLGRCDIGCPVGAKNTVDITYVARAETHGAEVRTGHVATTLRPPDRPGESWQVGVRRVADGEQTTLRAGTVVLAAGTLGSTRLLLKNRRHIPGLSPALGSRFSGNGDALVVAFDPKAPGVTGARNDLGPTMTSRVDLTEQRHLIAADGGLPSNFEGLLDVARGVRVVRGWSRMRLALDALLARVGKSDRALRPAHLAIPDERPSNADSLIYLVMGRDAADGQIRLTPLFGELDVRWSRDASAKLFSDIERTAEELGAAAQATTFSALKGGLASKFTTVHPLGGCPMADDPAEGVVDDVGRVHGVPGLRVLDGSIVPTSLGVNPSKTIAAVAERGAAQLAEELA